MPRKNKSTPIDDSEIQRLLDASTREPGVADMIEIYDRAELVYQRMPAAATCPESVANSATDSLPRWA